MKALQNFLNESLLFETYDPNNIVEKIESIKGFNNNINALSKPKEVYMIVFDRKTGNVKYNAKFKNSIDDLSLPNTLIWADTKPEKNNGNWPEDTFTHWYENDTYETASHSVVILENTKKIGIIIGYYAEENTELIKQFIKENLNLFERSYVSTMTNNDIDKLDGFFSANVKNYEKILKNNTFAAYFPSREESKKMGRIGMSNIPHITISKPPKLKGNFRVISYRNGNWAATEWPDKRRMMNSDGTPRYSNIDSIIPYLEKVITQHGDTLGVELK